MTPLTRAQRRLLAEVVRAGESGLQKTPDNADELELLESEHIVWLVISSGRVRLSNALRLLHASGLLNPEAIDAE